MVKYIKFIFIALLFYGSGEVLYSQSSSVNLTDIQNVQVDALTDEQLLNFFRQMQAQGFSVQEVGNIARARGMPASEVSRLTSRLNRLATAQGERGETGVTPTGRTGEQAELLFPPFGTLEDEMLISELRRLVEEREETEILRVLQDVIDEGFPIFGANLFSGSSMSFEPSFNIPTPADYIFGADDEIQIDIYGAAEAEYRLIVSPDGFIRIPNLGPIQISGLRFDEARTRIVTNLQRIYSGININEPDRANTFVDISLGRVRSINVNMIGEITQPGSYTVSSLATVFNMLYAAGGPSRTGSWRSIEVIRGSDIVAEFDLYDLIIHADQSGNVRLKDQDIIRVNPYINRVRLNGEVKRPGIYELKVGETLSDLISFNGGFSEEAYTERIIINRTTNVQRSISDVKWPEGGDIELRNGDSINITPIIDRFENRVRIEGAVFKEGDFELTEGLTLTELIEKAEGVKEDAFLERGIILRQMDNLRLESIAFSVFDILNGYADDIVLKRDDQVRISSIFDLRETFTVQVSGAVNNPEIFEFKENMTLEDAIFLANGLRDEAAAYRVEVARRVVEEDTRVKVNQLAEVFQFEIDPNFTFRGTDGEFALKPFDRIFVRSKPNYQRQLTVRLEGEVQFPGEYVLETRDARLSDVIRQAGGLSQYAFPEGASMQRILEITARDVDRDDLDRSDLLGSLNLENVDLDRFQTINDTTFTPVGIRLAEALKDPGGINDLRLLEGDIIRIPRQFQTVRVEGGVLAPVTMRFVPGRGLQRYVDAAGGTTDRGQRHRAYIVYANGEVDRTRRFLRLRSNPDVEPGATIIIPEKPASREMTPQETVALASSIASTALLFITLLDRLQDR